MMKLAIIVVLTLFSVIKATPSCSAYCGNITANCVGAAAQYTNMAHCMAMCPIWPVGTDADTSGNTLGCRAYHAGAASSGTQHCYHAGPSGVDLATGNAQCGTQCEAYCSIMTYQPGCNDTIRAFNTYAECNATCPFFPSNAASFYDNATGNSLQCRIYHAKVAFSGGATTLQTHCQHAAPLGGGECGNVTDSFCQIVTNVCTGTNSQYPSLAYCKDIAKYFAVSTPNYYDYTGDTISCRAYHAVVGGEGGAKAIHCAHGGASGNGSSGCGGDVCSTYCALSAKICPNNYATNADCMTACGQWNTTKLGSVADTSGDTFYCRLYHLGAAAGTGQAGTHCPHALGNSTTCGGTPPTVTTASTGVSTTGVSTTGVSTTGASNTDTGTPAPSGSGVILGFSVLALIANLF